MEVLKKTIANLVDPGVPQVIYAVQGDSARVVEVSLYAGTQPWNVPDGTSIYISYTKPSGESERVLTLDDGGRIASYSKNVLTLTLPAQITLNSGVVIATIVFVNSSGKQIATFPFIVNVSQNPALGGDIAGSLDVDEYTQLLAAISLERSRIDNLAKLKDGSTTGDAELIDIRVGFDAKKYTTAGDAVRGQVSSVDKNVAHLANFAGVPGDLFDHNKENWTNSNYAIPEYYKRLRSGYIPISQKTRKIIVKNNTADIRLYLELYSIDDSGEFVYMKDTGSRYGDTSYNSEGAAAIRIVIHRRDDTAVTVDDFYHASANIAITQNLNLEQKKIRVMQYNLGEFNMGRSHDNPYVDQTKIADYITEYKKFFGAEMADILCLEEFSEFIDAADTKYPTSETLIDGIYPNKTGVSYGNTLAARHTILEEEHKHYNNKNTDETGCLLHTMVTKIFGREVFVCSGNLRVMATEETRKDTFNQLLADCEKYDYVILGLDMNALSEAENRYYVETAEANGFSVANGGYFGNIPTLPFSDMYPNIDNIFVKGGLIVNAYAPDVSNTLASDHLPIVSDILLY